MSEMTWLGVKACGCATFARLTDAPPKRWDKKLKVRKVPVDQANLTVCRCQ